MGVNRTTTRRAFFVILVVLSLALLVAIMWPMAGALFVASVLAGALFPWQERLTRRFGGRSRLAAGVVTLGVLVAIVLPLAIVGTVVVRELIEGFEFLQETFRQSGIEGLVDLLPGPLRGAVQNLLARTPWEDVELADISAPGGKAAAVFGGVVSATGNLALQTGLMLVMLFFLLVDGATLVRWLSGIVPLPKGQFRELLIEFRTVSRSVMVSSIATASVQTVAALVGYLIARVPNPVFFSFLTFFFAFIPAIGAGGLSLALSGLLLLLGHPFAALFLAAWSVVVVGLSDNLVKTILIRSELELHGAVIFFSLVGGLVVFGPIGLLVGPMAVAFFLALVRINARTMNVESGGSSDDSTLSSREHVTHESGEREPGGHATG